MPRRKKRVDAGEPPPRGPNLLVQAYRLLETLLVLAVIAYVVLLLMARTDGFRDLAEKYLESLVKMPVDLKRARVDWRLNVHLDGVTAQGAASEHTPSVEAGSVEVELAIRDSLRSFHPVLERVILVDASADLSTTSTGSWEPATIVPLSAWIAKWLQMDILAYAPAGVPTNATPAATSATGTTHSASLDQPQGWKSVELLVFNGRMTWWEKDSSEPLATVEGIRLDAATVDLSARTLKYYNLAIDRAATAEGVKMKNLRLEVIDSGEQQLVLTLHADREDGAMKGPPSAAGLGKVLFEVGDRSSVISNRSSVISDR
jgi:hypothetical protein